MHNDPNGLPYYLQCGAQNGSTTPDESFLDAGVAKALLDPSAGKYFAPGSVAWHFSTGQSSASKPPAGFNGIFDPGAGGATPCIISNIKVRFVVMANNGSTNNVANAIVPYQISPLRDIDSGSGYEGPIQKIDPVGAIQLATAKPSFPIPANDHSGYSTYTYISETEDPRVNQNSGDWSESPDSPSMLPLTTIVNDYPTLLADPNNPLALRKSNLDQRTYSGVAYDASKLAYADMSVTNTPTTLYGAWPSDNWKRLPSVGLLSTISTGMQPGPTSGKGYPWRTLRFQKSVNAVPGAETPPDWLLTDLVAAAYNRVDLSTTQQYPSNSLPLPITYLNSTAGAINLNTHIFPTGIVLATIFNLPQGGTQPVRAAPLKALLKNVYRASVQNPTPTTPIDEEALATAIQQYTENKKTNGIVDPVMYYPGEICEVPGIADTGANDWEREAVPRLLASNMTTRSNTFSVWGVAQSIQKNPNNKAYDQFQDPQATTPSNLSDRVTGERRFHAVIERYVWPGADGIPGNGDTGGGTTYTKLGNSNYVGSSTNTIDVTSPTDPKFEHAYQPGAAVMKYRMVSFTYLN